MHAEITRRDYYVRSGAPSDKIIIGHVFDFLREVFAGPLSVLASLSLSLCLP